MLGRLRGRQLPRSESTLSYLSKIEILLDFLKQLLFIFLLYSFKNIIKLQFVIFPALLYDEKYPFWFKWLIKNAPKVFITGQGDILVNFSVYESAGSRALITTTIWRWIHYVVLQPPAIVFFSLQYLSWYQHFFVSWKCFVVKFSKFLRRTKYFYTKEDT